MPAARADLRQLRRYIARDTPRAADTMTDQLRAGARRLRDFPEMGRAVPEYGDPGVRELIIAPYRLLYRYLRDRDHVQVIAVIHGSRQLPSLSDL